MKGIICFFIFLCAITSADAVTTRNAGARSATASPASAYNYNYMYPYLNNQMRTDLNPGVTPSQSGNPISVITRTEQLSAPRRVVSRSAARSTTGSTTAARAAVTTAATNTGTNTTRRVVARSGVTARSATRSARGDASLTTQNINSALAAAVSNSSEALPSARCLADYTECMNGYCQREKTAYNRCYCSAKLAQIDAQYQPAIDSLIQQILRLRGGNNWSDAEMNKYWETMVGQYTHDNSWTNLENALNIDWAGMESRVRGQQAFATGHDYCVQHLRGCAYMSSNMRDAYRSEIARDCATYEYGLARIKNAAESIVESYSD